MANARFTGITDAFHFQRTNKLLAELAIGDAYGAGFEFSPQEKIAGFNDGKHYERHDLGEIGFGCYTDDTQMSIAIAELLVTGNDLDLHAFASAYVATYKRDPRAGYATGLTELLNTCNDGADLLARIRPVSRRNGAAMRAVPIGLLPTEAAVLEAASTSAAVTHNTVEGKLSAQVIALMAHGLAYRKAELGDLMNYLSRFIDCEINLSWTAYVNCDAIETMHAVCTMLLSHTSMHKLLRACVALGGDTDSVASIALGLASLSDDYPNDLQTALWSGLERGPFGLDYLQELDQKIFARYSLTVNRTQAVLR